MCGVLREDAAYSDTIDSLSHSTAQDFPMTCAKRPRISRQRYIPFAQRHIKKPLRYRAGKKKERLQKLVASPLQLSSPPTSPSLQALPALRDPGHGWGEL